MDRQQPAARHFSVGLGLIVAGLLVMVAHLIFEALFQDKLLDKFGSDYHRRPMGESYTGIGVVVVGSVAAGFCDRHNALARTSHREPQNAAGRGCVRKRQCNQAIIVGRNASAAWC